MTDTRGIARAIKVTWPQLSEADCLALAAQLGGILDRAIVEGWEPARIKLAGRHDMTTELGTVLKQLRIAADLSREEAARALEWSKSKIDHIENGATISLSVTDVHALLAVYGVRDRGIIAHMEDLARQSRRRR